MPDEEQELSPADLAAFDLLISIMQEEGLESVNLRDLLIEGTIDRYRQARRALTRTRTPTRELVSAPIPEVENLTINQLDVDVPLDRLIQLRQEGQRRSGRG